jgi:hypothetical protein
MSDVLAAAKTRGTLGFGPGLGSFESSLRESPTVKTLVMAFSCADEFAHSVAERVKIIEVCHGVVAEEPDTLEGRVISM